MGNLVACRPTRLYGVSKKSGKSGEFKLVPFDNDAFNVEIDESDVEETLTDLVKDLYGHEDRCCWFSVYLCDDDDLEETKALCFDIDYDDRLEIRNIVDLIDDGELSGCFQYFILVNGKRTKYQWVVAHCDCTVYSG